MNILPDFVYGCIYYGGGWCVWGETLLMKKKNMSQKQMFYTNLPSQITWCSQSVLWLYSIQHHDMLVCVYVHA